MEDKQILNLSMHCTDSFAFLLLHFLACRRGQCRRQTTMNYHRYTSSSEVSAECQQPIDRHVGRQSDNHCLSTYRPTYWLNVGRHIDQRGYVDRHISVDILAKCRSIGRHISPASVDMSTNTSVECQSICRLIYRPSGAQNTHDPIWNLIPTCNLKIMSVALSFSIIAAIMLSMKHFLLVILQI